jgi:hypothetical protein
MDFTRLETLMNINTLRIRLENKCSEENHQLALAILEMVDDDDFLTAIIDTLETTDNIESLTKQLYKLLKHGTGESFESTPYGDLWGLSRYLLQLKSIYSIH